MPPAPGGVAMAAMVDPCILHPFRAPVLRVRCAGAPGTADLPQRTLSDFTVYFTTFLRKKIHPPRGFSTSSKMFVEKEIENGFRCALAMFSGRIIFNFAFVAPCGARQTLFSREGSWRQTAFAAPLSAKARRCGRRARPLSQALSGLPALPKGEPLAWRCSFRLNRKASGRARPPLGELSRSD